MRFWYRLFGFFSTFPMMTPVTFIWEFLSPLGEQAAKHRLVQVQSHITSEFSLVLQWKNKNQMKHFSPQVETGTQIYLQNNKEKWRLLCKVIRTENFVFQFVSCTANLCAYISVPNCIRNTVISITLLKEDALLHLCMNYSYLEHL